MSVNSISVNSVGSFGGFDAVVGLMLSAYNFIILPIVNFLCSVLPRSPFQSYIQNASDWSGGVMSAINYFLPISQFLAILEVWVAAIFLWYLWRWITNISLYKGYLEKIGKGFITLLKSLALFLA